jgi:hypothetical protein
MRLGFGVKASTCTVSLASFGRFLSIMMNMPL